MIKQRLLQTLIESYGGIEPLVEEIEQLLEYGMGSDDDMADMYGINKNSHGKKDDSSSVFKNSYFHPEMKTGNAQHASSRIGNSQLTKAGLGGLSDADKAEARRQLGDSPSASKSAPKTSSPARTGGARTSARVGTRTPTSSRLSRPIRPVTKTTARATGTAGSQQNQKTTPTGQTTASNILTRAKSALGGSGIANGFKTATQTQSAQKPFGWNRYSNDAIGRAQEEWDNDELETGIHRGPRPTAQTPSQSSTSTAQTTPQSRGYVQGQKFGTGTGGNYTHNDYKSWSSDQQKAFAKNNPNTVRQWNKGNTSLQAKQVRGPRPTPQATANVLSNTAGTAGGIGSSIKR